MKRNFKEYPKIIFSTKATVNTFIDCLNKAKIFNDQIPYLVIHKGEHRYASKLEVNLTFKDDIRNICTSRDAEKVDEQLTEYVLKKLNEIPNFTFKLVNDCFIEILDKTKIDYYKQYLVVYRFWIFNEYHPENEQITNNCILNVSIDSPQPIFEILGK